MSDSTSETLKLKQFFGIIQGLPIVNMDPIDLVLMEPDCLVSTTTRRRLVKSVANFGICSPILVNCNNLVLDGKKRLEVAVSVGMKSVPVKRLTSPTTLDECRSIRVLSNPESKLSPGFGDIFAGIASKFPVKRVLERAKKTVNTRSQIDMRLQKESKIYEASLAQAAMCAVNSIGCIDSIMRNMKGDKDYLEKARKLLEKAIRYTVYTGVVKEKKIASRNHEHITKDSYEKEEPDTQADGSSLLEFHEASGDLRHSMCGFGAFPGL